MNSNAATARSPRSLFIAVSAFLLFFVAGCSTIPHEKGAIWCNEPLKYEASSVPFDNTHMDVARKGYIYALAGAYVLQGNSDESKDHWFNLPARMEKVECPKRDASGFEVCTFKLHSNSNDQNSSEIIVAYTGSNDSADWLFTNLLVDQAQYKLARDYVIKIAQRYPNKRLVVTGFSLGAALAGHVTKDQRTKSLVSEAWLFNPSPKLYTHDGYDKRIWVGALRGEILRLVRTRPMEIFWPGVNRIGAPWNQNAQDYYLISAFPIYGHYRWALARNILFVADYAHLQNKLGPVDPAYTREPREILEASHFTACKYKLETQKKLLQSQKTIQEKATKEAIEDQKSATQPH